MLWEQYGHPVPLTLLRTEAVHSCPQLPRQMTFLCVPGPTIVGCNGKFFSDHSFARSGSKVLRSLSPAIIRALEQMGHFSPLDLAFALVCHSCPQEPFHQYSLQHGLAPLSRWRKNTSYIIPYFYAVFNGFDWITVQEEKRCGKMVAPFLVDSVVVHVGRSYGPILR